MSKKDHIYKDDVRIKLKNVINTVFPSWMKSFLSFYINKNQIVNNFRKNKKYIVPGDYRFDKTFNFIYLNNKETAIEAFAMLNNGYAVLKHDFDSTLKRKVQLIIIKFLSVRLRINKKNTNFNNEFQGNIFLSGGNNNSFKIFDLVNEKILFIFIEKDAYDKKISAYSYFNRYFPMPLIFGQNKKQMSIIEEWIDFKFYNDWNDVNFVNIISDIQKKTINYFDDVIKKSNYNLRSPAQIFQNIHKDNELMRDIWNGINEDMKIIKFPFVKLHGDLWTSNLLINKRDGSIKYIDFEHFKDLVFFYDIFTMMWLEFSCYGTSRYLDEFMSGGYDTFFDTIFSLFNMTFKKKYKLDYLNVFLLVRYEARWLNIKETGLWSVYKTYRSFIEYINKARSNNI